MPSAVATVPEYLQELPEDRRHIVETIRTAINGALPEGYEEGMQYGMIGWYVPHSLYPEGYHCDPDQPLPFVQLGNQKGHVGLYLFCTYFDEDVQTRFKEEWLATGNRLDMGKSCIRIKGADQVPLDVVANVIAEYPVAEYVARYDAAFPKEKRKKKRKA